jgi:hypothetical protein
VTCTSTTLQRTCGVSCLRRRRRGR